ncbi:MAG: hypothetical protein Q8M22_09235 [Actinomycetota bacterium]|nr:hypothetical protein [Actinomycetota bacterium]
MATTFCDVGSRHTSVDGPVGDSVVDGGRTVVIGGGTVEETVGATVGVTVVDGARLVGGVRLVVVVDAVVVDVEVVGPADVQVAGAVVAPLPTSRVCEHDVISNAQHANQRQP